MKTLNEISALEYARNFLDFVANSPTSYHAASYITSTLLANGFTAQDEGATWLGAKQGFIKRGGAVIAWRVPDKVQADVGFRIVGTHTDSPAFKIKPIFDTYKAGFSQVNVELYGGLLLNSWLNRDLGIAGQISTLDGKIHLVRTPAIMFIPQLAPHLDRSANQSLELSPQRDYHPIWAIGEDSIFTYICEQAGVNPQQVAGTDLYAYDTSASTIFGGSAGTDFCVTGRQDNLTSVFASLQAFLEADANDREDVQIMAAFDHEEIGSVTFTGADSVFLDHILRRISLSLAGRCNEEEFLQMIANSSCVSADSGHSINPNKPEKHDPTHTPVLGNGPLLKLNANQRYATEAQGSALWARACHAGGVDYQEFVSNNDVTCGSTIGPAIAGRLGIVTVDVGVPLLSMHSIREVSSPRDLLAFAKALKGYFAGA